MSLLFDMPLTAAMEVAEPEAAYDSSLPGAPAWSGRSRQMLDFMEIPVNFRTRVPYRREFLDAYQPNVDSLLPPSLASSLHSEARWDKGRCQFHGALSLMTDFVEDFCWSSSKLEGCTLSRAESNALLSLSPDLQNGVAARSEHARMVLNHHHALEVLASRPDERLDLKLILDVQEALMNGLLPAAQRGKVRGVGIYIQGTAYKPTEDFPLLQEMLEQIAVKASAIRNPVEASFFLWLHLAYLQAFRDGNKRTGRLCANKPLLRGHCAPLSFSDVDPQDHVVALLGVYERNDVSVAVDLFEWMYRRSMKKYPWLLWEAGDFRPTSR